MSAGQLVVGKMEFERSIVFHIPHIVHVVLVAKGSYKNRHGVLEVVIIDAFDKQVNVEIAIELNADGVAFYDI
jgi:hypothetical protein